jgi:translation initiation factor 6
MLKWFIKQLIKTTLVPVSRFDITPIRMYGTASVGVYMAANDEYALIPADSPEKVDRHIEDTLKVKVIRMTIGGSPLLGVFTVMNNSGVLVPSIIKDEELELLRRSLGDLNVAVLPSRYTAIANLILVNNKRGVVSPIVEREYLNIVRDNLNIELEVRDIRGLYIVGSLAVVNDRGILVSPEVDEKDVNFLKGFFGVRIGVGTVNRGISLVRSGIVANNKGAVVGDLTTGFEMMRITEVLG